MESPLLIPQYKTLGAAPVPINFAEVYNALQQGVVDGEENPLVSIVNMKFYEVQDVVTISNHGYLAYAFLFSDEFFQSLTPEQQEILTSAARDAAAIERQETVDRETGVIEKIEASGTTVNYLTEAESQAFAEALQPVHVQFAYKIGRDLMDKAYAKIEALQS
jgi:C4-dicarboxylate-binding protein DctP